MGHDLSNAMVRFSIGHGLRAAPDNRCPQVCVLPFKLEELIHFIKKTRGGSCTLNSAPARSEDRLRSSLQRRLGEHPDAAATRALARRTSVRSGSPGNQRNTTSKVSRRRSWETQSRIAVLAPETGVRGRGARPAQVGRRPYEERAL